MDKKDKNSGKDYVVMSINTVLGEFKVYGPCTKEEGKALEDVHSQYSAVKLLPMPKPWYGRDHDFVKIRVFREDWFGDQFDIMERGAAVAKLGKIRKLHDCDDNVSDWDGESYYEVGK